MVAQQVGVKSSSKPSGCPKRGIGFEIDSDGRYVTGDTQGSTAWYTAIINAFKAKEKDDYCEFRDDPTKDEARDEWFTWEIKNAKAGRYSLTNTQSGSKKLIVYVNGTDVGGVRQDFMLAEGENRTIRLRVVTHPDRVNYGKGGNETLMAIDYGRPSGWRRCDITIIDDDNSAYAGRRKEHPYGGIWRTTPQCYGPVNCAYD